MAPGTVRPDDFELRARRAGEQVEALRAELEDAIELRDQIVLEAIDAGCSRGEVGRWARVSPTRITQVVLARALKLQEEASAREAQRARESVNLG